jgi:hypothetical protein
MKNGLNETISGGIPSEVESSRVVGITSSSDNDKNTADLLNLQDHGPLPFPDVWKDNGGSAKTVDDLNSLGTTMLFANPELAYNPDTGIEEDEIDKSHSEQKETPIYNLALIESVEDALATGSLLNLTPKELQELPPELLSYFKVQKHELRSPYDVTLSDQSLTISKYDDKEANDEASIAINKNIAGDSRRPGITISPYRVVLEPMTAEDYNSGTQSASPIKVEMTEEQRDRLFQDIVEDHIQRSKIQEEHATANELEVEQAERTALPKVVEAVEYISSQPKFSLARKVTEAMWNVKMMINPFSLESRLYKEQREVAKTAEQETKFGMSLEKALDKAEKSLAKIEQIHKLKGKHIKKLQEIYELLDYLGEPTDKPIFARVEAAGRVLSMMNLTGKPERKEVAKVANEIVISDLEQIKTDVVKVPFVSDVFMEQEGAHLLQMIYDNRFASPQEKLDLYLKTFQNASPARKAALYHAQEIFLKSSLIEGGFGSVIQAIGESIDPETKERKVTPETANGIMNSIITEVHGVSYNRYLGLLNESAGEVAQIAEGIQNPNLMKLPNFVSTVRHMADSFGIKFSDAISAIQNLGNEPGLLSKFVDSRLFRKLIDLKLPNGDLPFAYQTETTSSNKLSKRSKEKDPKQENLAFLTPSELQWIVGLAIGGGIAGGTAYVFRRKLGHDIRRWWRNWKPDRWTVNLQDIAGIYGLHKWDTRGNNFVYLKKDAGETMMEKVKVMNPGNGNIFDVNSLKLVKNTVNGIWGYKDRSGNDVDIITGKVIDPTTGIVTQRSAEIYEIDRTAAGLDNIRGGLGGAGIRRDPILKEPGNPRLGQLVDAITGYPLMRVPGTLNNYYVLDPRSAHGDLVDRDSFQAEIDPATGQPTGRHFTTKNIGGIMTTIYVDFFSASTRDPNGKILQTYSLDPLTGARINVPFTMNHVIDGASMFRVREITTPTGVRRELYDASGLPLYDNKKVKRQPLIVTPPAGLPPGPPLYVDKDSTAANPLLIDSATLYLLDRAGNYITKDPTHRGWRVNIHTNTLIDPITGAITTIPAIHGEPVEKHFVVAAPPPGARPGPDLFYDEKSTVGNEYFIDSTNFYLVDPLTGTYYTNDRAHWGWRVDVRTNRLIDRAGRLTTIPAIKATPVVGVKGKPLAAGMGQEYTDIDGESFVKRQFGYEYDALSGRRTTTTPSWQTKVDGGHDRQYKVWTRKYAGDAKKKYQAAIDRVARNNTTMITDPLNNTEQITVQEAQARLAALKERIEKTRPGIYDLLPEWGKDATFMVATGGDLLALIAIKYWDLLISRNDIRSLDGGFNINPGNIPVAGKLLGAITKKGLGLRELYGFLSAIHLAGDLRSFLPDQIIHDSPGFLDSDNPWKVDELWKFLPRALLLPGTHVSDTTLDFGPAQLTKYLTRPFTGPTAEEVQIQNQADLNSFFESIQALSQKIAGITQQSSSNGEGQDTNSSVSAGKNIYNNITDNLSEKDKPVAMLQVLLGSIYISKDSLPAALRTPGKIASLGCRELDTTVNCFPTYDGLIKNVTMTGKIPTDPDEQSFLLLLGEDIRSSAKNYGELMKNPNVEAFSLLPGNAEKLTTFVDTFEKTGNPQGKLKAIVKFLDDAA